MTSVLRTLQAEWNAMVPQAQARGIRRVRPLSTELLETIAYRRAKVEWLRAQLHVVTDEGLDSLTFGVELEFLMPAHLYRDGGRAEIARMIEAAGVPCRSESYNHSVRTFWKVVRDGSLDENRGAEVVSPILKGEQGFAQLRKVCDVLTAAGCRISKKCGLHVHVGSSTEQLDFFKNLIKLYASAEDSLDSMVAPSRRGSENTFCKSLKYKVNYDRLEAARTIDDVTRAIGQTPGSDYTRSSGRYCKLNLQAFYQVGTVEFRQHQGTVEANKAENWVRLCLRMCLTARKGQTRVNGLHDFLTVVAATESEKQYFNNRVQFFQRRAA